MSALDPIGIYLERVARALGRWQPGRRRILAEIEDHLRERVDGGETADEAVARFGDAESVAAGLARPAVVRRRIAAGGLALAAAVTATAIVTTGSAPATPLPVRASTKIVPRLVIGAANAAARPDLPAPPAGIRIGAYAPLSTGNVFMFSAYRSGERSCSLIYIARPSRLVPFRGRGSDGGGVNCEPPGRTAAVDMSLLGGSGLGGPFILYGTAPRAATELAITDADGRTRTFSLPRVPVRGEPSRQAVILDLTTVGIHSCDRLTLLAGGHILARKRFIPV
jgi:hypothetical protein